MSGLWKRLRALAVPPEERPGRRRVLRLAGLAVLVAFAAAATARVDLRRVAASVAEAHPGHLAVAVLACLLGIVLHGVRWATLLRPPGVRVPLPLVLEALVTGTAVGLAMPARAGDLVRAHFLARRARLSTASVIGSVAVDYVLGTATLVPLIVLTGLITPLPDWARHALILTSITGAAGIALVFLLRLPDEGEPPRAAPEERPGLVARLRSGLAAAHEPLAMTRAFGWGLLRWGAELAIAWFTLAAMDVEPTLALASLVVVATAAANAISVSPGNAGPFELAAMLPLAGLGVAAEPALAFALLLHVVYLAPPAALGAWVLLREARFAPRGNRGTTGTPAPEDDE